MKIRLVKIGKLALPVDELVQTYLKRLQPFAKVEALHLKSLEHAERLVAEAQTKGQHFLVLLDERGKQLSSPELAAFICEKMAASQVKTLTFMVGGPYGFSEALRQKADLLWSLSAAVFPSDMAWALVCEQVYRAFNIIQGTGYHHS